MNDTAENRRPPAASRNQPRLCRGFFALPQPARFLIAGGWNTFFGFAVYAALYALFSDEAHYLALLIPANILAITNCFLSYKLLVFRTKGKWLAEYLRCWLVYGAVALVNAGVMWLAVTWLRLCPVFANGLSIILSTAASYFSHKYFSFARRSATGPRSGINPPRGPFI